VSESREEDIKDAILDLNKGCSLYCRWFDTGKPDHMDGSSIAYELVSLMRQAISKLQEDES
jgi:hypothetical protein